MGLDEQLERGGSDWKSRVASPLLSLLTDIENAGSSSSAVGSAAITRTGSPDAVHAA